MNLVEIRDRNDADGGEGLLALLVLMNGCGGEQYPKGLQFLTQTSDELQVAVMRHPASYTVSPHIHLPYPRKLERTGEVIVVRSGRVVADFYNSRREYVDTRILGPGDVMVFYAGGHGFTMLEESELLEVKQGPYAAEADKIKFIYREDDSGVISEV